MTYSTKVAFGLSPHLTVGQFRFPYSHNAHTCMPHTLTNTTPRKCRPIRTTPQSRMVRVSVPLHVEAPREHCYSLFSDLAKMPDWSNTLKSVRRDPNDAAFSDWHMSWNGIRLSWRARDDDPIAGEPYASAIRWRSVSGLTHVGVVLFEDVGNENTKVIISIEYDIASLLAIIAQTPLLSNFVEGAIQSELRRFRAYALRLYRQKRLERTLSH